MSLEEALRAQEEQVDDLLKAANKYVGALKTWKKACQTGHIGNLQKAMVQSREIAPALAAPAADAASNWTFDVRDYLESGDWRRELQAAAGEKFSLRVLEEGETLVSSPVVIRAQAGRGILQIGKASWPLLRPQVVAAELKRLRDRAQSANSQEFLDGLLAAAMRLNKDAVTGETPPQIFSRFRDIYDLFSITPGWKKENPPAAFGQAIYALHRSDIRVTRSGRKLEIEYPSGKRKRERRVQRHCRRWPRHPLLRHSFQVKEQRMQTMDALNARLLVAPEELLRALDQECLLDYIKSGGASVKVVSGSDTDLNSVQEGVRERARQEGYFLRVPRPVQTGSGRQKERPAPHRPFLFRGHVRRGLEGVGARTGAAVSGGAGHLCRPRTAIWTIWTASRRTTSAARRIC